MGRIVAKLSGGGLLAMLLLAMLPASSMAALRWGAPVFTNNYGMYPLSAVSCPSVSQCTAVDVSGREVRFDPASPEHWSAYTLDPGHSLQSVACPSVSQCTAVDGGSREVTFDPRSPSGATPHRIDGRHRLEAVACTSVSRCVADDHGGRVVVFNPVAPAHPVIKSLADHLYGISCPTSTQCTALGAGSVNSELVTFDPSALGTARTYTASNSDLALISCPAASECVVGDDLGGTSTFDPVTQSLSSSVTRDPGGIFSDLVCPTTSQCTGMDKATGREITFDPSTSSITTSRVIVTLGGILNYASGLACPSATLCVAVSAARGQEETSFDPQARSGRRTALVDDGGPVGQVACPAVPECIALGTGPTGYGQVHLSLVFNPARTKDPGGHRLNGVVGGVPVGLSCPSAGQCTLVTREAGTVASGGATAGGQELTYDPRGGKLRHRPVRTLDSTNLTGVSCPTVHLCAAIDEHGGAITFNPRTRGHVHRFRLARSHLTSVVCVSRNECVAVDRRGQEIEFNPRSGAASAPVKLVDHASLLSVSCPAAHQCTAVGHGHFEITFDPLNSQHRSHRWIDREKLSAVNCPTRGFCVAVDRNGRVLQGNPRSSHTWTVTSLQEAGRLLAVSCSSQKSCVAVDNLGHAYTGRA